MGVRRDLKRLLMVIAVLIAGVAGLGTVLYIAVDNALVERTAEGSCWRLSHYDCWNLSPEFISRATGIDLPYGTHVTASGTHAWLSWSLSATVVYPKGAVLPSRAAEPPSVIRSAGRVDGRPAYTIYLVEHGGAAWPKPR
jgi:hypothetical protein